jgi:MOSC domain-containing protein YiiM
MPKEGVFGKVIKGGKIVAGDKIKVMEITDKKS